jgi:hypothetical protein
MIIAVDTLSFLLGDCPGNVLIWPIVNLEMFRDDDSYSRCICDCVDNSLILAVDD